MFLTCYAEDDGTVLATRRHGIRSDHSLPLSVEGRRAPTVNVLHRQSRESVERSTSANDSTSRNLKAHVKEVFREAWH